MDLVRGNPLEKSRKFAFERVSDLEKPDVLVRCLEFQMREPNDGRLKWLKEELESEIRDIQDLSASEHRQKLVDLLKTRFLDEMGAMLKEMMAGQIRIYRASVDLVQKGLNEGAILELQRFEVTEKHLSRLEIRRIAICG
jgi:hypothetical protein